jgi:uncharacterized protein YbjT (DUF2867 family)
VSTAIVIGGTGLVGKCLVKQLLEDPGTTKVVALVRRAVLPRHDKLQELIVDFERPDSFADAVRGDVLFSALGTTLGQAGSIAAQRRVDYDYQLEVAKLAARNGVKTYVLVSSGLANPRSRMAYLKMKGELERDVKSLGFSSVQILQPGLLTGVREKLTISTLNHSMPGKSVSTSTRKTPTADRSVGRSRKKKDREVPDVA